MFGEGSGTYVASVDANNEARLLLHFLGHLDRRQCGLVKMISRPNSDRHSSNVMPLLRNSLA